MDKIRRSKRKLKYPETLRGSFDKWKIAKDFYNESSALSYANKIGGKAYTGIDNGSGITYYKVGGTGPQFVNRVHHWWVVKR
jgi:hypothetical protein